MAAKILSAAVYTVHMRRCPKCKTLKPLKVTCRGCASGEDAHYDYVCLGCGFNWIRPRGRG